METPNKSLIEQAKDKMLEMLINPQSYPELRPAEVATAYQILRTIGREDEKANLDHGGISRERLLAQLNTLAEKVRFSPESDHMESTELLLAYINDKEVYEACIEIEKYYS